jgi:hypothetical protein
MWTDAKYHDDCAECEVPILAGERIVWDSKHHKTYCATCGVDEEGPDPKKTEKMPCQDS